MTKVILCLVIIFNCSLYSQDTIYSIENKRTQETITAICQQYDVDHCSDVSLIYKNFQSGEIETLAKINDTQIKAGENFVDEVAFSMESAQMLKNKYQVFGTFRKVCDLGAKKHRDKSMCIFKLLIGSGAFLAGGFGAAGSGFAWAVAGKTAFATTVGFSLGMQDLYFLQMALFYPALAVDFLRLVTVLPVKKIIGGIQTRRLKRRIIPVLEDVSFEIENYSRDNEFVEGTFQNDIIQKKQIIKNKDFKKILKTMREMNLRDKGV